MSKSKPSTGKGKKIVISLLAVAILGGVAVGTTAILTKGFTQWGIAEKAVKGGYTVDKFTVDSLKDGTLKLANSEGVKLEATFEGSINEKEALILGDKKEAASQSKEDLRTMLQSYGTEPGDVESIESMTVALNVAKFSKMSLSLDVQYDEEKSAKTDLKLPYFDAIRVNYKIDGGRMIYVGKTDGSSQKDYSFTKRTNTVTSLYENISLFSLEKESTMSSNIIDFYSFSLEASKENDIEIQSIELVRTTTKNADKFCYVTQS